MGCSDPCDRPRSRPYIQRCLDDQHPHRIVPERLRRDHKVAGAGLRQFHRCSRHPFQRGPYVQRMGCRAPAYRSRQGCHDNGHVDDQFLYHLLQHERRNAGALDHRGLRDGIGPSCRPVHDRIHVHGMVGGVPRHHARDESDAQRWLEDQPVHHNIRYRRRQCDRRIHGRLRRFGPASRESLAHRVHVRRMGSADTLQRSRIRSHRDGAVEDQPPYDNLLDRRRDGDTSDHAGLRYGHRSSCGSREDRIHILGMVIRDTCKDARFRSDDNRAVDCEQLRGDIRSPQRFRTYRNQRRLRDHDRCARRSGEGGIQVHGMEPCGTCEHARLPDDVHCPMDGEAVHDNLRYRGRIGDLPDDQGLRDRGPRDSRSDTFRIHFRGMEPRDPRYGPRIGHHRQGAVDRKPIHDQFPSDRRFRHPFDHQGFRCCHRGGRRSDTHGIHLRRLGFRDPGDHAREGRRPHGKMGDQPVQDILRHRRGIVRTIDSPGLRYRGLFPFGPNEDRSYIHRMEPIGACQDAGVAHDDNRPVEDKPIHHNLRLRGGFRHPVDHRRLRIGGRGPSAARTHRIHVPGMGCADPGKHARQRHDDYGPVEHQPVHDRIRHRGRYLDSIHHSGLRLVSHRSCRSDQDGVRVHRMEFRDTPDDARFRYDGHRQLEDQPIHHHIRYRRRFPDTFGNPGL